MTGTAAGATLGQRWRTLRWVALALAALAAIAAVGAYLTAPTPGGRMEADSTSRDGARALVTLLRDRGVDVTVAATADEVRKAARPDSLVVIAQTFFLVGDQQAERLTGLDADLLLVAPGARLREALAPAIEPADDAVFGGAPDCDLREATQAGLVQFGMSTTFEAAGDVPVTSCYHGAVVRYTQGGHTVTVTGSAEFMMNSGLLKEGNAALAMNLAGTQPHVVWYAPQRMESESQGAAEISDLVPAPVRWIVLQLCLVVALIAFWKARRLGPLVAERLPVVVRASETVEGRGRLYRSRQARDRAADALRTATLQRLLPRLGVGANSDPVSIVAAVAARTGTDPGTLTHALYGPPPGSDDDLVHLARHLDDIERQVARS